nr:hypothetical protein [Staphylococcus aureus]
MWFSSTWWFTHSQRCRCSSSRES